MTSGPLYRWTHPQYERQANKVPLPADRVERSILVIRGQKVMLDMDLAALYEVPTRVLGL